MPAGGGMDFTYGQQHEVTGGPDAGEKSRPRARETAATYKNQFMSASLSKKVVGISRVANFQELKDTSDLKELSVQDALFLKPIAQMNISVSIPAIVNKRNQKAISNWEVMERLKAMVAPREFTHIKVTKSTLDFIRFEGEVANKPIMEDIISRVDGKHMKLSGFTEPFKIKCGPAKSNYPTKTDWNNFFRDAVDMDETKPGERPDTVHISNLPCKFFSIGDNIRPSEGIIKRVFQKFGEIRQMDIPVLDPYRPKIDPQIDARKHANPVLFDAFIQFKSYDGFMLMMDGLRDMKLVLNREKVLAAPILVTFDKSKHLSERELKKRYLLRRRILKEEDAMADEKKRRIEEEERNLEEQKLKEAERAKIKDDRRRRREEKRRKKRLERTREKEQKRVEQRIQLEERKLLLTQRRLEAVRMLTYLFDKMKTETEYSEVKALENEIERRRKTEEQKEAKEEEKKQAALEAAQQEKMEKLGKKEESLKEKLLRKKQERMAPKPDVKLEEFSDEEYDTQKRFREKQIKHTITMQRPMGRRSKTPEAIPRNRGVTPSPPRRRKKSYGDYKHDPSPKRERRRSGDEPPPRDDRHREGRSRDEKPRSRDEKYRTREESPPTSRKRRERTPSPEPPMRRRREKSSSPVEPVRRRREKTPSPEPRRRREKSPSPEPPTRRRREKSASPERNFERDARDRRKRQDSYEEDRPQKSSKRRNLTPEPKRSKKEKKRRPSPSSSESDSSSSDGSSSSSSSSSSGDSYAKKKGKSHGIKRGKQKPKKSDDRRKEKGKRKRR